MGSLLKILGSPFKDTIGAVGDLLGKFITDPQKKLEAQIELTKIEMSFQQSLVTADVEWAKAQADVVKSEAQSASWMARNWRPILMLVFTYLIAHTYIFAPILSLTPLPLPEEMWELLKIGVGGYIVGRSVEKSTKEVAKVLKK